MNILQSVMNVGIRLSENGIVPDRFVRMGIRRLLRKRLAVVNSSPESEPAHMVTRLATGPIARTPDIANSQHYEVPPAFFKRVLGPGMKYSSCYFESGENSLQSAEEDSLRRTCRNADLKDGQSILELGCGWGSLSLWMARCFPKCKIMAVSNSNLQREFIMRIARQERLHGLEVVTADMNDFIPERESYDRIVSVEMFEHMWNYGKLLERLAGGLRNGGKLLVHYFCHRNKSYPFEDNNRLDWMAQHFFTGGIMPSLNLLAFFPQHFSLEKKTEWSGIHYQKTCEHWLRNMNRHRKEINDVFEVTYGKKSASLWYFRWRIFFMACSELFGFNGGTEWLVAQTLLQRRPAM